MDIVREIEAIQQRNARVEADKAWEMSKTRKVGILLVTYVLASLLMWMVGVDRPFVSALVPSLGFFLSTLSLGCLKRVWLQFVYGK